MDEQPAGDPADEQVPDWVPDRVPEEWEIEGPAVSISLGDAADVDPALLTAMTGPDGLGGNALCQAHEQDAAADVLRPGPVLAALTEQAVSDVARLTDEQLMGALSAARRLENRAAYLQMLTIAEFGRRREAQAEKARASRLRKGLSSGDFPDMELSIELLITQGDAGHLLNDAASLTSRLSNTFAGMAAGSIDYGRAATIVAYTDFLGDADAAHADEILAAAAPGLRPDRLARKAAALEMKLDPEAARLRKERAKQDRRVEVRRERSGNASISGRELPAADVMASKANLDAIAARLRQADAEGTLDSLRAWALTELLQGRDPLRGLAPVSGSSAPAPDAPDPDEADPDEADPDEADPDGSDPGTCRPNEPQADVPAAESTPASASNFSAPPAFAAHPRASAPFPATINLTVPVGTLLGWSSAPTEAGSWGLLDPDDTRDIVRAASRHPRTRWCATIIGPDGTAIAHACSSGQHPWPPPDTRSSSKPRRPPDASSPPSGHGPDSVQLARLHDLLRRLNIAPEPIARGTCDHRHAEDRYTPSRKLQDLIRARTATCSAPGCGAQAVHCDLDHTDPYPEGRTDECNVHPFCRRHHRCKQAPGWHAEQPEPGVFRLTTPAGRTHTTTPTVYDV